MFRMEVCNLRSRPSGEMGSDSRASGFCSTWTWEDPWVAWRRRCVYWGQSERIFPTVEWSGGVRGQVMNLCVVARWLSTEVRPMWVDDVQIETGVKLIVHNRVEETIL